MSSKQDVAVETGSRIQAVARDKLLPALCAALLGLVLIYAAGFAETHVLHNAAHDERHAAGFPCH